MLSRSRIYREKIPGWGVALSDKRKDPRETCAYLDEQLAQSGGRRRIWKVKRRMKTKRQLGGEAKRDQRP